jgi:hypothetical protein
MSIGRSSSRKEITPATLPFFPLYILVMIYADNGAQSMLKTGIGMKPITSKTILIANFL